jgi:hypothetical protein
MPSCHWCVVAGCVILCWHNLSCTGLSAVLCCAVSCSGGGSINRSRLVQLLVFLARDEEAAYKRRAVSVPNQRPKIEPTLSSPRGGFAAKPVNPSGNTAVKVTTLYVVVACSCT